MTPVKIFENTDICIYVGMDDPNISSFTPSSSSSNIVYQNYGSRDSDTGDNSIQKHVWDAINNVWS